MSEESAATPAPLRRLILWLGPTAGTAVALWLHAHGDSTALAVTLGCLVWVALWWLFEPVPAAFTALIPMSVLPMAGVISPKQVAEAFGNELILLMMGGFMMAAALERNHAHRRLALGMVRLFGGHSGRHLLWGFVFATGLISMWISNTATTIMMLPVAMAILEDYRDDRLRVPLILGIAYAASVGGWGTPIGTPPNLVFMHVYEQTTGSRMGFLEWMRFGIPIVALFLPLLALWLGRHLGGSPAAEIPKLGPWHRSERRVLMVFTLIVAAWIFRSEPFGGWSGYFQLPGVNDASIALFGVLLMGVIPDGRGSTLIDWPTAERVPWAALVLFAGGIALATAFQTSGLGDRIVDALGGLRDWPAWLLIVGICLGVTLLSEIASNTATAVLLMPILAVTATASGLDPALLMVPAVLAASCGFMLPVATAPNLVAYGTGMVPLRRMLREGVVLDLIGVAVLSGACIVLFWR
ncbi:MAG: SLC13/DASS family transporter [Rhodanobacteraceae bacterium]|nr:SLC13/DASS family transporter [Rhodanobacteraceae bacterium]